MRRPVAVLIGLVVALGSVVVPAPAQAATPDVWAFAYLDNPAPPVNWVMDRARQAGTFRSTCGQRWATVTELRLGHYEVRFPCTASSRGIVHVTAVDPDGRYCAVGRWIPSGVDLLVSVFCFGPVGGGPDRSRFSIVYTTSSGVTPTYHGYVHSAGSGVILASYNSTGAVNTVSRRATGLYSVFLTGLSWWRLAGNVQVTAVSPTGAARRCRALSWGFDRATYEVVVDCFDGSNARVDADFVVSFNNLRGVYGAGYPPNRFGYIFAGGPPGAGADLNFNSLGGVNRVLHPDTGTYRVEFPTIGAPAPHLQVTGFADLAAYCQLGAPPTIEGDLAVAELIVCFDGLGHRVDGLFLVAYASSV